MASELLVDTPNPEFLDTTLQQLGAVLVQDVVGDSHPYIQIDGHYVARALSGDVGFLKFALTQQGYAQVVDEGEFTTLRGEG